MWVRSMSCARALAWMCKLFVMTYNSVCDACHEGSCMGVQVVCHGVNSCACACAATGGGEVELYVTETGGACVRANVSREDPNECASCLVRRVFAVCDSTSCPEHARECKMYMNMGGNVRVLRTMRRETREDLHQGVYRFGSPPVHRLITGRSVAWAWQVQSNSMVAHPKQCPEWSGDLGDPEVHRQHRASVRARGGDAAHALSRVDLLWCRTHSTASHFGRHRQVCVVARLGVA